MITLFTDTLCDIYMNTFRHDIIMSPRVIWFTGLSGAGKTTLAQAVQHQFELRGITSVLLDGDALRQGLSADLGFSLDDRLEQVRRVAEVARLFTRNGLTALVAVIAPTQAGRQLARDINKSHNFIEIHVDCPLEVCIQRDTKGLYRQALAGSLTNFTGVNSPYEKPDHPELTVSTHQHTLDDCITLILDFLDGQDEPENV